MSGLKIHVLCAAWLAIFFALAGCSNSPPSVKIIGGGFIFNYRVAEAYYGVVVEVGGEIPDGAYLEAAFENPAGGAAIIVRQAINASRPRYKLETPPLTGIAADRPYQVTLRLFPADGGTALAETERSFSSNIAQDVLPDRPLTFGPGYHRPPAQGDTGAQ